MRRKGNIVQLAADIDNVALAFVKARRGKQCSHEVQRYAANLQQNLLQCSLQLLAGRAVVGGYRTFTIYDPKQRTICAAPFGQRVLHHAIMNVCHEIFDRQLIATTFASRRGRGTYAAIESARNGLRRYPYVAKLDVRKYFDSIDHQVLRRQLHRLFKDYRLLSIFDQIIASYSTTPGKGLPIGNLTSQYFANHYLSCFDHYAKEQLQVPHYVRYMDDVLIFGSTRREVTAYANAAAHYVSERLLLQFKPPVVRSAEAGVVFLGYTLRRHSVTLCRRSRLRYVRRLRLYNSLYEGGEWDIGEYRRHVEPLTAFTQHAYSKRYRRRLLSQLF